MRVKQAIRFVRRLSRFVRLVSAIRWVLGSVKGLGGSFLRNATSIYLIITLL
jgi:hypothetical protein